MLPPRRIFRPSASTRRWRILAGLGGLTAALLLVLGAPSNLFGSAPLDRGWTAPAATVRVLDGDTLRLGEQVLRLGGLTAPPRGRACPDAQGRVRDCGTAATEALAALVTDRAVECRARGADRQGRVLGLCHAGGVELNASLVAAGWATADRDDARLGALQDAARRDRRGLWAAD